jgi:hypothetical protein
MKFQEVFSHLQVLHRVPVGSSIELARTTLNCFKGLEVLRLTSC